MPHGRGTEAPLKLRHLSTRGTSSQAEAPLKRRALGLRSRAVGCMADGDGRWMCVCPGVGRYTGTRMTGVELEKQKAYTGGARGESRTLRTQGPDGTGHTELELAPKNRRKITAANPCSSMQHDPGSLLASWL